MNTLSFDGCGINDKRDKYAPRVATFTRKTSSDSPDYAKEFGQLFACAPELLESLIACEKVFNVEEIDPMQAFCAIEKARAAIAKATGGSQ